MKVSDLILVNGGWDYDEMLEVYKVGTIETLPKYDVLIKYGDNEILAFRNKMIIIKQFDIEQKGRYIMTLRDLYCYTPDTQKFIIFSESDRNDDLWERLPIFKGYLENCNAELMDEIVDHFLVGANRTIIVVLCI